MNSNQQPIIKKVKKVYADGHHGGAWKVAYADFVTAMMAFFLLMWLLNATTEDQRKGIADYFNPTVPISQMSGGGTDLLNGSTVFAEKTLAKNGSGGSRSAQSSADEENEKQSDKPKQAFEQALSAKTAGNPSDLESLERELHGNIENNKSQELARHIQTHVTPEGLVIELVDRDGSPLFDVGSTNASSTLELLLDVVTTSLTHVQNDISIVGHTDSLAYSGARGYSNWELSTDRAHIARKLMVNAGLQQLRIDEVAGKADTEPLVDDRYAPQNRRISITILRS